jgi:sirohydrochlorin cobaltochelatase
MVENSGLASKRGLILFGHGARDPRWAEPFERLLGRVRAIHPTGQTRLAFLELVTPNLETVVTELAGLGCTEIRIAPIFVGQGGHVREQLPALVLTMQSRYPEIVFTQIVAVGEDEAVLDAIAACCVRSW